MSGGSYEYLCHKHIGEDNYWYNLGRMYGEMSLKYKNHDGFDEFDNLVRQLLELSSKAEDINRSLHDVFYAFEWYESNDYSEEQFLSALKQLKLK